MKNPRRRLTYVAALMLIALLSVVNPASVGAGPRPFAVLDRGQGWSLVVFRHKRLRCLKLQTHRGGLTHCRVLRAPQADLSLDEHVGFAPHPPRSWVTVETSLRVRRVQLDLAHAPDRDLYPSPIGARRARKAQVKANFKYAVVSMKGCVGVRGATAYGYDGSELESFPPPGIDVPTEAVPDPCEAPPPPLG